MKFPFAHYLDTSALKESGYESDSQLVFRRRTESTEGGASTPAADPQEQRLWYRDIQRGGEVPLHGLRKPQPDRPQGKKHIEPSIVQNDPSSTLVIFDGMVKVLQFKKKKHPANCILSWSTGRFDVACFRSFCEYDYSS